MTELGTQLRIDSIHLAAGAGSGHPTSSMSAADLIAVLAANHLAIDPERPAALGNDHLVFSKGHATPLLYATLARLGIVPDEELSRYRRHGSRLEGHPTPLVPGVPVATGSLGLGLPMGVGLALAARDLDRTAAHTWVLCGDSEMAEGSMWEAMEQAGWLQLANLTAIVDVNRLGQTGPTRYGWDLEPYRLRFEAAGWEALLVDGHDVVALDATYAKARNADRPTAVIARTHKGSGASETDDQDGKHGRPLDDPEAAIAELGGDRPVAVNPPRPAPAPEPPARPEPAVAVRLPSWSLGEAVATRAAFGEALLALGEAHRDLVALDGEVGNSTYLDAFADAFSDRFFQMYIAEQLMVATGIGLQVTGWRPVLATFAAFCSRAHDVLRMAAIGRADLSVVGSHAGVSIGEDGPSQMGLEDLAMMRALYGSTVVYPCDANQTADLLRQLIATPGVTYLRTTRGDTPVIYEPSPFPIGGSRVVRSSPEDAVAVVAAGVTVHEALAAASELAARGVPARVIDAYSIKPIDAAELARTATEVERMVVVEDHRPEGGLGEAVLSALARHAVPASIRHLAVRNLPGSASPEEQRREASIDSAAIVDAATALLDRPIG
jgi:transketolase